MAFTWIEGELQEVGIEWLHVEGICEVNSEKELLRVRVSGVTDGLDGYGYFDLFQLCKNLTNDKITGNEVIYLLIEEIPADQGAEIPVFGAVTEAQIVAVHIIPKETITGNDINYMQLKLVNKDTGAVICTKTFLSGVNAPAYEVMDFGPVDEEAGAINIGQGVSFVKEEFGGGMTLPKCLLIIEWNLR